ncbi:kinase-like protein [Pholiota conissans]|uniref:Kinase-like protein n=1 Tax=Pholiota conissans TaxID=109636 RepID=A0A9P5YY67_9AGAR|nr:kinase-like protein [Pholiota conissans]
MGTWMTGTAQKKVAIKELRVHTYHQRTSKLEKRLRREMRIWGNLDHVNIVSLHGVTFSFGKCPAMVCEWMNQGTLADYIEEEHVNLDYRGRLNICLAITRGLSYLHSQKVIHGDLSPANVLMDGDVAHLSDFGLSNVIAELQGPSFFTSKVSCAARWIAPELQSSQDSAPKLAMPGDIYSFASVAFYIMTGIFPFAHLRHEYQIIAEILRNIQAGLNPSPSRPASSFLTDECWDILMMCWALDPAKRPDICDVERRFNQL